MRAVEFLLLLEVGEVLADGDLRNAELLGQLRDRDGAVLLQQRQDAGMTLGQAQDGLFADFVHRMGWFYDASYKKIPTYPLSVGLPCFLSERDAACSNPKSTRKGSIMKIRTGCPLWNETVPYPDMFAHAGPRKGRAIRGL